MFRLMGNRGGATFDGSLRVGEDGLSLLVGKHGSLVQRWSTVPWFGKKRVVSLTLFRLGNCGGVSETGFVWVGEDGISLLGELGSSIPAEGAIRPSDGSTVLAALDWFCDEPETPFIG